MGSISLDTAKDKLNRASEETKAAFLELGKTVFETEKDELESPYADAVMKINEFLKKETLWHQYTLSLEGKMMCEKCNALIPSDSAFCNKCGEQVEKLDFSILGIDDSVSVTDSSGVCPKCGTQVVAGAMFCEKCGQKL